MDQVSNRIKQLTQELKAYIETRLDLLVLNVGEQVTKWLGESIQKLIGFTILGIGFFFALIALAIYLGDLLESPSLGYLAVAVPLILIGALFVSARPRGIAKSIQNQFMDGILESIDKKDDEVELKLPKSSKKALAESNEQKD